MNIAEAIRIALQSLWANKLRSVLTLLGVVIGVGAVNAVVTFVSGINDYVAKKIFNLGADVFIASKMSQVETNVDRYLRAEKRKNLDMDDYDAVRQACRHCDDVGASMTGTGRGVKHNEQSIEDTTVQGLTPSTAVILDTDLTSGRMVNETDVDNHLQVAVVGTDIVEHLLTGARSHRPGNSRQWLDLPRDRRRQEKGQDARPERRQLRHDPHHRLLEAVWVAQQQH